MVEFETVYPNEKLLQYGARERTDFPFSSSYVQLSQSILFPFLNKIKIIHRIFHYYVSWVKLFFKREFLTNDSYRTSKTQTTPGQEPYLYYINTKNNAKSKKRFDEEGRGVGESKGKPVARFWGAALTGTQIITNF